MITKAGLQSKVSERLHQTIQHGDLSSILVELGIEPEKAKTPVKTPNGILETEAHLFDESIIDKVTLKQLEKLEKMDRAINIEEIMEQHKLNRNQVNGIIRRINVPYTLIGSGNQTECWLVGKYYTKLKNYMKKEYKPRYTQDEQISIEQTDEQQLLDTIQKLTEKAKLVDYYKEIIDKQNKRIQELENELAQRKNDSFVKKIKDILGGNK